MKYISTREWRDLTDGHLYRDGEPFPYDGRAIPPERIDSLMSGKNLAGIALIRPVEETVKENITEAVEAPKKAVRSRKKADK